jgi:hypothetical protein
MTDVFSYQLPCMSIAVQDRDSDCDHSRRFNLYENCYKFSTSITLYLRCLPRSEGVTLAPLGRRVGCPHTQAMRAGRPRTRAMRARCPRIRDEAALRAGETSARPGVWAGEMPAHS